MKVRGREDLKRFIEKVAPGVLPGAHAATHAAAGSDQVSPESINALPEGAFVGLTHIYVQATEPTSPSVGDLWIDTSA